MNKKNLIYFQHNGQQHAFVFTYVPDRFLDTVVVGTVTVFNRATPSLLDRLFGRAADLLNGEDNVRGVFGRHHYIEAASFVFRLSNPLSKTRREIWEEIVKACRRELNTLDKNSEVMKHLANLQA